MDVGIVAVAGQTGEVAVGKQVAKTGSKVAARAEQKHRQQAKCGDKDEQQNEVAVTVVSSLESMHDDISIMEAGASFKFVWQALMRFGHDRG
jgi:TPP-dependent indolepyruvate ferredoxin oxidoreductase alpha subunit